MLELNGKTFIHRGVETAQGAPPPVVGQYRIVREGFLLYDMLGVLVGYINRKGIMGEAIEWSNGEIWGGYDTPECIGRYQTSDRKKADISRALLQWRA